MTDIFTVTSTEYDETYDILYVDAYQSNFQGEAFTEDEAEIKINIAHRFCSSSSIALTHDQYGEHDATFLPTVLLAFAKAFQSAHDEQNPGDSPALTKLETFEVYYPRIVSRAPLAYDETELTPDQVFAKLSALKA